MQHTMIAVHILLMILLHPTSGQCPGCNIRYNGGWNANCRNANLTEIPKCLPNNVGYLDVSQNRIVNISADSFQHVPQLKYLFMSSNKIEVLPADLFRFLPKLKTAWLYFNNIAEIPVDFFSFSPDIENVDVSNNKIEAIPADSFRSNTALKALSLGFNNLKNISHYTLSRMDNLTNLLLIGNQLSYLPNGIFTNFPNLFQLDLSYNNFKELDNVGIPSLTKLTTLNLDNNYLSAIGNSSLSPSIKNLNLVNNKFTTMNPSDVTSLRSMTISLSGNPWNCDCAVNLLLETFKIQNITLHDDPKCATPAELAGKYWSSLSLEPCNP